MFAIIERVWKIRDQLKNGSTNYEQILRLLGDTESRMWDKVSRMLLQVEQCQHAKREMCEMCRALYSKKEEKRSRNIENYRNSPHYDHSHISCGSCSDTHS